MECRTPLAAGKQNRNGYLQDNGDDLPVRIVRTDRWAAAPGDQRAAAGLRVPSESVALGSADTAARAALRQHATQRTLESDDFTAQPANVESKLKNGRRTIADGDAAFQLIRK